MTNWQALIVGTDDDYTSKKLTHLDLWIGPSNSGNVACELDFGTISGQTIIQNPPTNLPVNAGGLWDGSACHDASSPNPFVYPNPLTSGLCSGSSPSGGSSNGESTIASPPSTPSLPNVVSSPSTMPPMPPTTQPSTVPSPSSQIVSSSSVILSSTSTTLQTSWTTPSISSVISPTATGSISGSSDSSDCASWGGCLGNGSLLLILKWT